MLAEATEIPIMSKFSIWEGIMCPDLICQVIIPTVRLLEELSTLYGHLIQSENCPLCLNYAYEKASSKTSGCFLMREDKQRMKRSDNQQIFCVDGTKMENKLFVGFALIYS
jgi:hypothetical protein